MSGFSHLMRNTSLRARTVFGTVVVWNVSVIAYVHYDQVATERRMKLGVKLDKERLKEKLEKYGIKEEDIANVGDLSTITNEEISLLRVIPEHAVPKNHLPVPPEQIPELSSLGVTRDSTFVPGMERPDVDPKEFDF